MNVKELIHSQQQPQAPKAHKKKPTIRQAIRTMFSSNTYLLARAVPGLIFTLAFDELPIFEFLNV